MSWQLVVDYIFVFSVIIIWFMLAYQFILFLLGFLYGFRANRQRKALEQAELELPAVSLMIPAHNEGLVIAATLEGMLAQPGGGIHAGVEMVHLVEPPQRVRAVHRDVRGV